MSTQINFPDTLDFGTNGIAGYTVTIEQDEQTGSPRDWNNLGTLTCFHPRYNLGDEHSYSDAEGLFEELSGLDLDRLQDIREKNNLSLETYQEILGKHAYARYIILPVYLYDHSGLALRTTDFNDRFDSGQVGYIYASLADVRERFQVKRITKNIRTRVENYLKGEIETYHQFISGQVYFVKIESPDGGEVESCGGFYDDDAGFSHILDEFVEPRIKYHASLVSKAHQDQVKAWIRNRVPLQHRAAPQGEHHA